MVLLKKIINLILYGNFWIGFGALALAFQTQFILTGHYDWNDLTCLVFTSTVLLYALHRIVGILRVKDFLDVERYAVIMRFRHHIIVYAILAGLASIYFFFKLKWRVQLALIVPGLVSMAYVLPIFGKEKRLRDFNQIKIFLVAMVWAFVTAILPFLDIGQGFSWPVLIMIIERALFVFAITLPFDIRDMEVDDFGDIKTIPAILGERKTIWLALGITLFAFIGALFNYFAGFYTLTVLIGLAFSYLTTAILIYYSDAKKHDYYYSGLMDGTMIFQFLFILAAQYLF